MTYFRVTTERQMKQRLLRRRIRNKTQHKAKKVQTAEEVSVPYLTAFQRHTHTLFRTGSAHETRNMNAQ